MINALITALFLIFPALVVFLNNRFAVVQKIGIVLICYISGIIVGNIGVIPESFSGIQTTLQDVSVCLALPLVLFSLDIKKWFKTAKKGIVCMGLAVVSILLVITLLHLVFSRYDANTPEYAGLAAGVYTGGTPNIASIKTAIGVDETTYIIFNTYDTVISMAYMLFITSGARLVFNKVFKLSPYEGDKNFNAGDVKVESPEDYKGIFKPAVMGKLVLAVLLSAAILGVSYVLGSMVKGYETAITILLVTTLAIICSLFRPIRQIQKTTQTGMYIIYIFCFTVATTADLSKLVDIDWTILAYVTFSIFGTLIIHAILCKICKIDSDTMIITSVSAICSPPFVPVVAGALKNQAVMISGIATGIIGYAIGNYLGIAVHWFFSMIG